MRYDTARMRHIGMALGYPRCCVDHFCGSLDRGVFPADGLQDGEWRGTGFVPCPDHAGRIAREGMAAVLPSIEANRLAPFPFQFGHGAGPDLVQEYVDALDAAAA